MPSSRAVLADLDTMGLDPTKPHKSFSASGHLKSPKSVVEVTSSDETSEDHEKTKKKATTSSKEVEPEIAQVTDPVLEPVAEPEVPILAEEATPVVEEEKVEEPVVQPSVPVEEEKVKKKKDKKVTD